MENVFNLPTKEQFDTMNTHLGNISSSGASDASNINYSNITSGLLATNVQDAINELDADIGNKSTLTTTDKTNLVNAVNETKEQINNLVSQQVSHVIQFTRDASLIGTQKITLPFKPKALIVFAMILNVAGSMSWGMCDEYLIQKELFDASFSFPNTYNGGNLLIHINQGSNETAGRVTLLEDDGVTISWEHGGAGAVGTIYINMMTLR